MYIITLTLFSLASAAKENQKKNQGLLLDLGGVFCDCSLLHC